MYRWMVQAWHISFMISRPAGDSSRMLLRPSEHMWQRHSLSGFPYLLILLSSSSHWWRAMATSDRHCQRSRVEYTDSSVPMWCLVSQTPCHHWCGVPHPVLHGWDKSRKEVAAPSGCLFHGQERPSQATPSKGW